jgi:H+-transporting ATPase
MVADIPSDASSAGSAPVKPPPHVHISVAEDLEKANHHNGQIPRDGRKHSRVDWEDDDDDEDLDALIEELESNDPDAEVQEEIDLIGGARCVPEEMLQTDTRVGLIEPEVVARRKKYGLNQMKEEKENLLLKFLGYFVGPIQFVMEVRIMTPANTQLGPDSY